MPFVRRWHVRSRLGTRFAAFMLIFWLAVWAMPNALLYDLMSAVVTATATGVLVAYIPGLFWMFEEEREPTSGDYLVMGICSAWLARDGNTVWGWLWRFVGRPDWMPDHWFALTMLALTFMSACLHLTADAVDGAVPKRVWVLRGIIVALILAASLTVVVWNLQHGGYLPDP